MEMQHSIWYDVWFNMLFSYSLEYSLNISAYVGWLGQGNWKYYNQSCNYKYKSIGIKPTSKQVSGVAESLV